MKRQDSLTPSQFAYIVAACEAILKEHGSSFAINGIPWLHVLNSHTSMQGRYLPVFNKRTKSGIVKAVVRGTGVVLTNLFLSLFSVFRKKEDWRKLAPETDVLFISHLLNRSVQKNAPDFYFQDLPHYLRQKGYTTAIALMKHIKGFKGFESREDTVHAYPEKFVLPAHLDFGSELRLTGRCARTAVFFFRQFLQEKDPLKKSFLRELAGNAISGNTLRAYRLHETISTIIRRTDLKAIAFTWEGHGWERLACHAAKTASKKIKAIAYQHTVLFPSSHALKQSRGNLYDPDTILTVGSVTRKILAASPGLQHVSIREYGSPRLINEPVYTPVPPVKDACLVTPEGLEDECIALFSFAVHAAKQMPETNFIFRTHPVIVFADLQDKYAVLRNLPANVTVSSNKNIDEDFKQCSWLIYRSSSVSFLAVLAGLRPLYLQIENEISNDVLYELKTWRKSISSTEDLQKVVKDDKNAIPGERNLEHKDAYQFSKEYMQPYQVAVFEACIRE